MGQTSRAPNIPLRRAGPAGAIAVVAALFAALAGCASSAPSCQTAGPRGWFSGWGSNAGNAFTMGLRQEWEPCDARAANPSREPRPFPAPSADPTSELSTGPLPPPR